MRRIHYLSGIVLSFFIGLHLTNHLVGMWGVDAHIAWMENLRPIYRNIFSEIVLLAAVGAQVWSGIALVRQRRGTPKIGWDRGHIWSGLYLSFFLIFHVSAVMMGRFVMQLDTNFYFGAAGMNAFPTCLFFVPYYVLAIMAFFTHIAAINSKKMARNIFGISPSGQSVGILIVGGLVTFLVLWGMTQGFQGVAVPAGYEVLQGK
jgi:hypothetical protein